MFNSNVLDIAIGLVFTFLAISLVASTAMEAVSSAMSWRAATLLKGVKSLLNDQQFNGLALAVYNHGLVNALSNGQADGAKTLSAKPSYIDPKLFAAALTDVGKLNFSGLPDLKASIAKIQDPQLQSVLDAIADRTQGNIDKVHNEIAAWFDQGMDRVSGSYKRWTQLWTFLIAFIFAILLNIDTVKIAEALWNQPMLLKGFTPPQTGETAQQALKELESLSIPFGWKGGNVGLLFSDNNWLAGLPGWFIAAFATLFGAPFWFDTLKKFTNLRGAGANPAEKKADSAV